MRRKVILTAGIIMVMLLSSFGIVYASEDNLDVTVSNLTATPSEVNAGDNVNISFDLDVEYTGSEDNYFKAGQTIKLETNIYDLWYAQPYLLSTEEEILNTKKT